MSKSKWYTYKDYILQAKDMNRFLLLEDIKNTLGSSCIVSLPRLSLLSSARICVSVIENSEAETILKVKYGHLEV